MKKSEIIQVWKSCYKLDSKTINQVLEFVLNMDKKELFLLDKADDNEVKNIYCVFEKIYLGYPLPYITHNVNFMWIDFYVDKWVLIPRDDTEILVKEVVKSTKEKGESNKEILLDIWTWSGIIPISIIKNTEFEFESIFALEISENAYKVAERNIKKHKLESKINLINIDFRQFEFNQFEWKNLIVTANLPYIKDADFENMDFWVYSFEPKMALYWWKETWFELYEELIGLLLRQRNKFNSIVLFIEIGFDQYDVSQDFLSSKWLKFEYFKDTNNIYRVIKIIF